MLKPGSPHVRFVVRNGPGLRASNGTRVLLDRYFKPGEDRPVTIGSAAFGWTSADAPEEAVVIFSGAARPFDLGWLRADEDGVWRELVIHLPQLVAADAEVTTDRRHVVGTGTRIRLVIGSDEAEARFYDVAVYWSEVACTPEEKLENLRFTVAEVDPAAP